MVATSIQPDDDAIADLCATNGIACFRGHLDDVLDRFYRCAQGASADHVVRLTGDCPLTDPGLIDSLVGFYLEGEMDYASNCRPPSLPDGLDAEIFSIAALEAAWSEADDPFLREHVTPFIVRQPKRFNIANWTYAEDLSALRWTVDEPEDFAFVSKVYELLYPVTPDFNMVDVLVLLRTHPDLIEMNKHFLRNQGSRKN